MARDEMDAVCLQIVALAGGTNPIDTGTFPSLATVITDLTTMQGNNLSGAAAQGQIEFDDIPFLTDNKTTEAINSLTTEVGWVLLRPTCCRYACPLLCLPCILPLRCHRELCLTRTAVVAGEVPDRLDKVGR